MKRVIGAALLFIGIMPPAISIAGIVIWANHMYAVGIDPQIITWLIGVVIADLGCIALGIYLVTRPRQTSD